MKLIPLTQGKFAKVDDEDYDFLMQYKWQAKFICKIWYAARAIKLNGKYKSILMHREILKLECGRPLVDHKDRDGLNNQKENIRTATDSQNCTNRAPTGSSKFLGVCRSVNKPRPSNRAKTTREFWIAAIVVNRKRIHLGVFPFTIEGEIAAAKLYDSAAKKHHGEFANLNFKL